MKSNILIILLKTCVEQSMRNMKKKEIKCKSFIQCNQSEDKSTLQKFALDDFLYYFTLTLPPPSHISNSTLQKGGHSQPSAQKWKIVITIFSDIIHR